MDRHQFVEFEVKFPTRHVEMNFPWDESIDSLPRVGFRQSFQMQFLSCLLERWDHPDGRYRLVAYKGGGLYVSEDVDDPHWREIIDVIIDEGKPPLPLVSEDWFELEIIDHERTDHWNTSFRRLSPDEIPTTSAAWEKFAQRWATKDCNRTISLRNGRSGETIFSDTFRRNRDGSVRRVAHKKPKSSS